MFGMLKSLIDKCWVRDRVSFSISFFVCGFEGRMGQASTGSGVLVLVNRGVFLWMQNERSLHLLALLPSLNCRF